MKQLNNKKRLMLNTLSQYVRTVINIVLSLYSTRLILNALGESDYGVYVIIGGVVSMLTFVTNAMLSTTQRFLSYNHGKGDVPKQIFSNSLFMHLFFSVGIWIILEGVGFFLFDGFLNIMPDRIVAAKIVYQATIMTVVISFISAPFKALLISHENIVYISVIEVFDGVLKVLLGLFLIYCGHDKLILYGFLMTGIYFLNMIAYIVYDYKNYEECIIPRLRYLSKSYFKSMGAFIGWQLYNTGCVVGRTQGIAIVLNKFFGTVVNASFGIALHVNGAVSFISAALMTSINPQIVKAEGEGNRDKMLNLAQVASKFSFLLLSILVVPLIFVIEDVLHFWLGRVPEWCPLFCRVILITALIDQITSGLIYANQAIGNLKSYSLTINTCKFMTVPIVMILLWCDVPLRYAIWVYSLIELICALSRLPYLKITGGLNISEYIKRVFVKISLPFASLVLMYYFWEKFVDNLIVFTLGAVVVTLIYGMLVFLFALTNGEQKNILGILKIQNSIFN